MEMEENGFFLRTELKGLGWRFIVKRMYIYLYIYIYIYVRSGIVGLDGGPPFFPHFSFSLFLFFAALWALTALY